MAKWVNNKRVPNRSGGASQQCDTNTIGSCCYRNKNGKNVYKDNVSCQHCTDPNIFRGIFSKLSGKKRVDSLEMGCCDICSKSPKHKPIVSSGNKNNSKFRSMVDKRQILPEKQDTLDTTVCQSKYERHIKRCNKCIGSNSTCKKNCLRFAEIMKIQCLDIISANKKSVSPSFSEELKSYYRCVAKNKEEYNKNIQDIFNEYACLCNDEFNTEDTKLSKEFEVFRRLYSGYEQDCKSLLPTVYSDTPEKQEASLGCCCQYIKDGEDAEISKVGSRNTQYSSDDLRKCECISYSECIANRALYDVCWSADCDCENNSCSGREDSSECSCCQDLYTESACYSATNDLRDPDHSCWIKICDDSRCWVQVPSTCDTCQKTWSGVRVGTKILREDDISNKEKPVCTGNCQQSVVFTTGDLKCQGNNGCKCSDEAASGSENNKCRQLKIRVSNQCKGCPKTSKEKKRRGYVDHLVTTKCCDCKNAGSNQQKTSRGGATSSTSSPTPAPTPTTNNVNTSQSSSSAGGGSYGY